MKTMLKKISIDNIKMQRLNLFKDISHQSLCLIIMELIYKLFTKDFKIIKDQH